MNSIKSNVWLFILTLASCGINSHERIFLRSTRLEMSDPVITESNINSYSISEYTFIGIEDSCYFYAMNKDDLSKYRLYNFCSEKDIELAYPILNGWKDSTELLESISYDRNQKQITISHHKDGDIFTRKDSIIQVK